MQPIVYSERPLLLPGNCKGWRPALGCAELLLHDRSVKPPRLNSLENSRVLGTSARDLLQRTEALKSLASSDAEPHGLLRIGLAHAAGRGDAYRTYSGAD